MGDDVIDEPGSGEAAADDLSEPSPRRSERRSFLRVALFSVIGAVVVFGLMQLVPYRVDNPPVKQEPSWDTSRTRQLAVAACYDCHSNETRTYRWEKVAPLSWWITNHVKDGRRALNFSECTPGAGNGEVPEAVRDGSMPPSYYTWLGLHSNAKLTAAERLELAAGLSATLSGWDCGRGGG